MSRVYSILSNVGITILLTLISRFIVNHNWFDGVDIIIVAIILLVVGFCNLKYFRGKFENKWEFLMFVFLNLSISVNLYFGIANLGGSDALIVTHRYGVIFANLMLILSLIAFIFSILFSKSKKDRLMIALYFSFIVIVSFLHEYLLGFFRLIFNAFFS